MKQMKLRQNLAVAFLLLASLAASAQLPVVGDGGPGPAKAQHLTAELVAASSSIAPGGTLQAGLVITLDPQWHVYWANAGDAGLPPRIAWTLPPGIAAGPIQFPIPTRLPNGPLMDFGYENAVTFPIQFTAAKSLKTGKIHLDAQVSWLVCREVCIPGKAHLGLDLTSAPGASVKPTGALADALKLIPGPLPADAKFTAIGGKSDFVLTLITGQKEANAEKRADLIGPELIPRLERVGADEGPPDATRRCVSFLGSAGLVPECEVGGDVRLAANFR